MDRLPILDAHVAAASKLGRIAEIVADHPDEAAVAGIADELGCDLAAARAVWSTPLRMFGPAAVSRVEAEAAELRRPATPDAAKDSVDEPR